MVDRSLYQCILYHGPRLLGDHRGRSLSCPLYYLLSFVPFVPLFCICPSMSMRRCPPMLLLALQGALYAALCNNYIQRPVCYIFTRPSASLTPGSVPTCNSIQQCNAIQCSTKWYQSCQSCRSARRHFLLCSGFSYFVYRLLCLYTLIIIRHSANLTRSDDYERTPLVSFGLLFFRVLCVCLLVLVLWTILTVVMWIPWAFVCLWGAQCSVVLIFWWCGGILGACGAH